MTKQLCDYYIERTMSVLDRIMSAIKPEGPAVSVRIAFGDLLDKLDTAERKNAAPDQQN